MKCLVKSTNNMIPYPCPITTQQKLIATPLCKRPPQGSIKPPTHHPITPVQTTIIQGPK